LQAAESHTAAFAEGSGIRVLQPAVIRLLPVGDWSPDGTQWPGAHGDAGTVIFRGYVMGIGVRTMRGSIRPTIQLIHWLSDLNFSSALSNQSHPTNAGDLSWDSTYVGAGQETTESEAHFVYQTAAAGLFTPGNIKDDLWGKCIQPFLWSLSEQDQIKTLPGFGVGPDPNGNSQSQKALERIQGGDTGAAEGPDYTQLRLQIGNFVDHEAAKAIGQAIQRETAAAWWSNTTWSKLVNEFAAAFMFAVVPQVEEALVVPYIPGTRELWKTITSGEYNYIDTVSSIPRPIQSVAIYSGIISETQADGTGNPGSEIGVGGYFRPAEADAGMLMALRPPAWMASIPAFGENAASTAFGNANGNPEGMPNAFGPTIAPADPGNEWGNDIEGAAVGTKDLFDRLAHALYVQEVLRGRFGVLSGKLRFDIAPGSTIKIEGTKDRFIAEDSLRPDMVGEVHRVTCSLDAEGGDAKTSFQLAHLRTVTENEEETTSVDVHPLYEEVFPGSPLSEELSFRDEVD
jgi:hypothetical protein